MADVVSCLIRGRCPLGRPQGSADSAVVTAFHLPRADHPAGGSVGAETPSTWALNAFVQAFEKGFVTVMPS
jgi:hypothetical protein